MPLELVASEPVSATSSVPPSEKGAVRQGEQVIRAVAQRAVGERKVAAEKVNVPPELRTSAALDRLSDAVDIRGRRGVRPAVSVAPLKL